LLLRSSKLLFGITMTLMTFHREIEIDKIDRIDRIEKDRQTDRQIYRSLQQHSIGYTGDGFYRSKDPTFHRANKYGYKWNKGTTIQETL